MSARLANGVGLVRLKILNAFSSEKNMLIGNSGGYKRDKTAPELCNNINELKKCVGIILII